MPQELTFKRTAAFRRAFDHLPAAQQLAAKRAFATFRKDIYHPSLRNHIIHKLSSRYRTTVRAVCIEGDLRATYMQQGDVIVALDIGTHAIYR